MEIYDKYEIWRKSFSFLELVSFFSKYLKNYVDLRKNMKFGEKLVTF